MLKKFLNIGVSVLNDEALNRKIRISNFIAIISLVSMTSFMPLAIVLKEPIAVCLLAFFAIVSLSSFILHLYNKHSAAFYIFTLSGYIYFACSTLSFGLISNMHYFMLVMCMISVVIFDHKLVNKLFIALSIVSFFALKWFMKNKEGYLHLPADTNELQENVGYIIMFLIFIITSIFFIFFKNENLNFQKEILIQKEIIEEKNKDITASITYAKRIQESLLPTEKYIDKSIKRLKKE